MQGEVVEGYLDHAATSRSKPPEVWQAMQHYMLHVGASPGRSVHGPGIEAGRIVANAREDVARLFGIHDSANLIFTLNCTEALNLAIMGTLGPGDHVIATHLEHNSVMRPLRYLEKTIGVSLTLLRGAEHGIIGPEEINAAVTNRTRMLIVNHASNVNGAIQPLVECGQMAKKHGLVFLVDAAQSAGHIPLDVSGLDVDLLAFSGHKGLLGPSGTGGLYVRDPGMLRPLKHGGTGSRSESEEQPEFAPDRFESGTPNTAGIAGLGAAARYLDDMGISSVRARIRELGNLLGTELEKHEGVIPVGPLDMALNAGVFSFLTPQHDIGMVAGRLANDYRIMVRVGLQCAPSAHKRLGTFPHGTIRASIGHDTTEAELEHLLCALTEILS